MTNKHFDFDTTTRSLLTHLITQAVSGLPTTYGAAGMSSGLPSRGNQLGLLIAPHLEVIYQWCQHHEIPNLASLACRASDGIPGNGFWKLYEEETGVGNLKQKEKEEVIRTLHQEVFNYYFSGPDKAPVDISRYVNRLMPCSISEGGNVLITPNREGMYVVTRHIRDVTQTLTIEPQEGSQFIALKRTGDGNYFVSLQTDGATVHLVSYDKNGKFFSLVEVEAIVEIHPRTLLEMEISDSGNLAVLSDVGEYWDEELASLDEQIVVDVNTGKTVLSLGEFTDNFRARFAGKDDHLFVCGQYRTQTTYHSTVMSYELKHLDNIAKNCHLDAVISGIPEDVLPRLTLATSPTAPHAAIYNECDSTITFIDLGVHVDGGCLVGVDTDTLPQSLGRTKIVDIVAHSTQYRDFALLTETDQGNCIYVNVDTVKSTVNEDGEFVWHMSERREVLSYNPGEVLENYRPTEALVSDGQLSKFIVTMSAEAEGFDHIPVN